MGKDDEEVDISWVEPSQKKGRPSESHMRWPQAFTMVSLGILFVVCWLGTLWIRR
jgi:hypothetical protein